MVPVASERLRRSVIIYATLAMAVIALVVAAMAIAPLAMHLHREARNTLVQETRLKGLAIGEILDGAITLAQQITSRSSIRMQLENYNAGKIARDELSRYTSERLNDALNLSPDLLGIIRFARDGTPIAMLGNIPAIASPPRTTTGAGPDLALITFQDRIILRIDTPIIGGDRQPAGHDVIFVSADSISEILRDPYNRTIAHRTFLISLAENGRTLLTFPPSLQSRRAIGDDMLTLARRSRQLGHPVFEQHDGQVRAATGMAQNDWVLVTSANTADSTANVDQLLLWVILGSVILIGAGAIGMVLVLRPLTGVFIIEATEMARQIDSLETTQAELAEKSRILALSNADLEEFAYAASHDLQEPVRTITSFTQLLQRRYQGKLGTEADEFIGFIQDGAERMRRQIADLLAYARLDRGERQFAVVDLSQVVAAACQNLTAAIEASGATIDIGPLPQVRGNFEALVRLMQNLLSNALKFVLPGASPRVDIRGESRDDQVEIIVRDNGIGIDPAYQDKIFHMFSRLHAIGQYDGSGIGLATCRKVAELHHGRIWVVSAPGKGAEFHISLPVSIPDV